MTTTQNIRRARLTTEYREAQNLGAGFRYLGADRVVHTVASATLHEHPDDMLKDEVTVVTTTGATFTYAPWRQLPVFVIDGRPV